MHLEHRRTMQLTATGWTVGLLAGMFFVMSQRVAAPHLVDDRGNPFLLRFAPLQLHPDDPERLRSSLLPDSRSDIGRESLVPAPPWSLTEDMSGISDPDGLFLSERAFGSEAPVGTAGIPLSL
jgi:hypothetical protein